jgi:hypothetical protein
LANFTLSDLQLFKTDAVVDVVLLLLLPLNLLSGFVHRKRHI